MLTIGKAVISAPPKAVIPANPLSVIPANAGIQVIPVMGFQGSQLYELDSGVRRNDSLVDSGIRRNDDLTDSGLHRYDGSMVEPVGCAARTVSFRMVRAAHPTC